MVVINNKPCDIKSVYAAKSTYNRYDTTIKLLVAHYDVYNNAALMAETLDGESYATLSVNICPLEPNCFAVDVNNCTAIDKWLEENNIALPTGLALPSGYVLYPVYKFTDAFLNSLTISN